MKIQENGADLFLHAVDEAASIVALVTITPEASPGRSAPMFRRLRDRLTDLPVYRPTRALLGNLVDDAEILIARSEPGASVYQMTQAIRRLLRLRAGMPDSTGRPGQRSLRVDGGHPPRRPNT